MFPRGKKIPLNLIEWAWVVPVYSKDRTGHGLFEIFCINLSGIVKYVCRQCFCPSYIKKYLDFSHLLRDSACWSLCELILALDATQLLLCPDGHCADHETISDEADSVATGPGILNCFVVLVGSHTEAISPVAISPSNKAIYYL